MAASASRQKKDELRAKVDELRAFIASRAGGAEAERLLRSLDELAGRADGKRYGLVFEKHREPVEDPLERCTPVLREDETLRIERGGQTDLLIEGDNLAALRLLQATHSGAVDFIYIDPPYPPGSSGFRYGDDYVSRGDAFAHSGWLSFMEKRLREAGPLLAETGCILISINENELFGLKLLCDEIFGEENYLTTFAVKVRHENRILKGDKDFHEVFEYLLYYRKSPKHRTGKRILDNSSDDDYVWTLRELAPPAQTLTMGGRRVDVFHPGQYALEKGAPSPEKCKRINIRGSLKEGNSSGRFFMKHLAGFIGQTPGYVYKVERIGDDGAGFRYFIIPENEKRKNGDYLQGVPLTRAQTKEAPYANLLDFQAAFNTVGYEGGVEFRNGKKPMAFLQHCFALGGLTGGPKTVLDFFAGSGSTGHALLAYNRAQGTEHRFILCNNNENNICREIAYERLRRAITQEDYAASLRYYRVDYLPAGAGAQGDAP